MTVQQLIEKLKEQNRFAEVQLWDSAEEKATSDITVTEFADGKVVIW
jgi:hypothetical protein